MKISLLTDKEKKWLDFDDVEAGEFFVGVCPYYKHRYLYYKFSSKEFINITHDSGITWRGEGRVRTKDYLTDSHEYIECKFRADRWEY